MSGTPGRVRIALVGLEPRWIGFLAAGLNERFGDTMDVRPVRQGAGLASLPRFAAELLRADLVVRVGVTLDASSRTDALLTRLSRGKLVLFWIGTDVATWCERAERGATDTRVAAVIASARSIAGAHHLTDELAACGVTATPTPFPAPLGTVPDQIAPLPDTLRVLSYAPAARFGYYGGPALLEAARALPDVRFALMGEGTDALDDLPANVEGLGWVADPSTEYEKSVAVVRLVPHDAIGGTVMEGLIFGRHVIYSTPLPHTTHVEYGDTASLVAELRALSKRHEAGDLQPNTEGRAWALKEFDPDARFAHLRDVLLGFVSG